MKVRHLVSALIAVAMAGSTGFAGAQFVKPVPAPTPPAALERLDPAVVQANMEKLQQQAVLANRLADKFQGDAATQFGASFNALDWKRDFGSRLMYQPVQSLTAALTAPNLSMVQNELFNAAGRTAPKHTSTNDWELHFLVPCRIVDTRSGGGGMLGPGWRFWYAGNTAAVIAAQGGAAAGCGSFGNADGFLLYVTAVPPGAFGGGGANFITVQHDAAPTPPTAATMNYYPGDNIANFAITTCDGCGGGTGGFNVYASGATHVVIDLIGWAGRIGPQVLDCVDTAGVNSGLIANAAWGGATAPACAAGYALTGGSCNSSSFHNLLTDSSGTGGAWFCGLWNETGSSQTITATGRCCRVPTLTADTPGG